MPQEIRTINTGGVNCYLLKTSDGGYVLIDTGFANRRIKLEQGLQSAGCKPGNLKLIVLTHGDSDHAGNCAYLRDKYSVKIALHRGDSGMVERGDMSWNRKAKPDKVAILFRLILFLFRRSSKFDVFTADIALEDGQDLAEYGLDAKVLHLRGHSQGSVGILTAGGDLFCGDLVWNIGKPGFHYIDDLVAANASIERLKSMEVETVYPGHGKPFRMERLVKKQR